MKQLIRVINLVESESIDQVSFYKDTGKLADSVYILRLLFVLQILF